MSPIDHPLAVAVLDAMKAEHRARSAAGYPRTVPREIAAEHRIDHIFATVEPMLCASDWTGLDAMLADADPAQMGAEAVVALLIATLPEGSRLPQRAAFIERARPLLDREPEGADEVLRGLIGPSPVADGIAKRGLK